jgi:large subunit ribosomal protein L20
MVRIKSNIYAHKRKKRVLKEAKGQFGDRSKRYKEAIKSLIASRQYAYFDRKKNKSNFRTLWIIRLNAACREAVINYSRFVHGLKSAQINLDRKVLADLAVREPDVFAQIVQQAKTGKPVTVETPVVKEASVTAAPRRGVKAESKSSSANKKPVKKRSAKKL